MAAAVEAGAETGPGSWTMSSIAPLNPVERRDATAATASIFRGVPLDFAKGATCLHLVRQQLVAFGYGPPEIPNFRTHHGAVKALRKSGHKSLESLIDTLLPRIAPARMRVGDIAMLPGAPPFGALVLCAGGKVLGWHGEGELGLVNIIPEVPYIAAWGLS